MFENHRKSLIQHCERSELHLRFEWPKVNEKCQKWSILASFWKHVAYGQTVLPDTSLLIVKKWWKMPLLKNSNATFWIIFKQCGHSSSNHQLMRTRLPNLKLALSFNFQVLVFRVAWYEKLQITLICYAAKNSLHSTFTDYFFSGHKLFFCRTVHAWKTD